MRKTILFILLIISPLVTRAQYDQKISINLSSGVFKTFGKKFTEYTGPLQMPNYKMGFNGTGGLQVKIGDRLSLSADFGIMISNSWNYRTPDKDNWLYWTIDDTITGQVLEEGYDYMDIHNFSISIKPKYYLLNDMKWNPFFSAGINIDLTQAWFENNLWVAQKNRGLLPPDETIPYNDNLEESFGIGFNPGIGVEYTPNDKMHFYLESGYYFIMLEKNNFKDPSREENFNAFLFQVGVRLNFIKSKEL
jgi:hypothetical protein